jgi:hypothetical protein
MTDRDADIESVTILNRRLSRRRAIARLGIGSLAVYGAPTVTPLGGVWARDDDDGYSSNKGGGGYGKGRGSDFCPPGQPGCGGGGDDDDDDGGGGKGGGKGGGGKDDDD